MTFLQLATVAIGGCLGAVARFYIAQKWSGKFPIGTLFVNLLGSFLLGFFVSLKLEEIYILLIGTGFIGAFTTFSTFNKELFTLQKFPQKWIMYFATTYGGGLVLAYIGYCLGEFWVR